MGKKTKADLPENLATQATRVICNVDANHHTQTVTSAHVYRSLGIDNAYDFDEFKQEFDIRVTRCDDSVMEFDMVGADPAIANAFRRIMISEVPTMAIEHVFIINNTSVIADEVLAHRLGLVPIRADPRLFEFKGPEDAPSETNTVVLRLHVKCERKNGVLHNEKVFSSGLEWLPAGSEIPDETGVRFTRGQHDLDPVVPVHDDILLARLAAGQEIVLEAHCVKGYGKEHAKWSPVATAWYRLLPEAVLLKELPLDLAKELKAELPKLVVLDKAGKATLRPAREVDEELEKFRRLSGEERFAQYIQLRKVKTHFLFTIESTGIYKPKDIFIEAVKGLMQKIDKVADRL